MFQNLIQKFKIKLSKLPIKQITKIPTKVTVHLNGKNDFQDKNDEIQLSNAKRSETKLQSTADLNCYTLNLNRSNFKKVFVYNSFTKVKQPATANGEQIYVTNNENIDQLKLAKAYICGPTVYDESHIGHAMTYLRFDLIRRVLRRYCAVDLVSIVNITDIDDKIINRSLQENKTYEEVSNYYSSSFLKDLNGLNILPFNAYVPVTSQIDNIIEYIQLLEEKGYAYLNDKTGDIDLDTSKIDQELSSFKTDSNLPGRKSQSDFTLWKSHKPNEPFWEFKSKVTGQIIKGRPGWHIECSVISNSILGNRIDFHFGGHDLLFPHHVNESRCCKAFNCVLESNQNDLNDLKNENLVTDAQFSDQLSKLPIHKWCNSWLHFGSLKIKEEKMSKSLNNFIQIRKFLKKNPKNSLRLLCIIHPYKRDITYDEGNLKIVNDFDMKITNFFQTISDQKNELINKSKLRFEETIDLTNLIKTFIENNLDGIADDFDLNVGWSKLIELITFVNKYQTKLTLYDLIKIELVVNDYLNTLGLIYHGSSLSKSRNPNDQYIIRKLVDYRREVRRLILDEKINQKNNSSNIDSLIKLTDNVRTSLASNQLIIRDEKFAKKKD